MFGVGIGETEDEFRAFGVPKAERGKRTDETIECLRLLWTGERVSYQGQYVTLDNVRIQSTPVQSPMPIYIGGRSDAALRRTARLADGWTGVWCSARRCREAREKITQWAREGRDPDQIRVGIQVWTCIKANKDEARTVIANEMSSFYGLDFRKFEHYVAHGSVDEVVEFIEPYVEAGVDHVNFIAIDDNPLDQIPKIAEVARKFGWLEPVGGVSRS